MSPLPSLRNSGNLLLDQISDADFATLKPLMQPIRMVLRQVLQQSDAIIDQVYFPTTGLISLMTVLEEEEPVEAGTVGREGFVGMAATLGVEASPHRAICQMGGDSWRLPLAPFLDVVRQSPELARILQRYIAYSLRFAWQAAACNALHEVEARACRWLLIMHDQADGDEFAVTHEFLSYMLGVRRQSVTVVAGLLQNAGIIEYRRGIVTVRNREMLEEAACECYSTMRKYYNNHIPKKS